jgi:superfamily I DNA/RNA helicase
MNEAWWVSEADLDDEQKKVIALGSQGNYLLIGPPGSGKTNLLLLRANYLTAGDKPDLVILVFTRTLREFIAAGAKRYLFSAGKVQTYIAWARRLLEENGVQVPESTDFQEERQNLLSGLKTLIDKEQITDDYYDAILLDEAHDYLVEEIEVIRAFSRNLFCVADSRQQIYKRDPKIIEHLQSYSETIELRFHYRNGIQVCRLADQIMKGKAIHAPMEPNSHYNEVARPSSVEHVHCKRGIEEQCEVTVGKLETQLQAYPNELLGVICPRREEFELIRSYLGRSQLSDLCVYQDPKYGYKPFDDDHRICVSTIHGSKGLEFTALHILACDTFRSPGFYTTNRNMTFTAVTRAKTSLCLYYSGDLYGYLQKALAALAPRPDLPKISEAFGRRR